MVGGISWYGNCIGVPDVAGEICFDESYSGNPLVNAMCVGLVRADNIATAAASELDNIMLLVGAGTGRDGIHGASGLASRTFEGEVELRPTCPAAKAFQVNCFLYNIDSACHSSHIAFGQHLRAT